jgi:hypothetical protein
MPKTFQSPATLSGISSKVDGGLSIRFVTKELTPEEKLTALEFQNEYGWLLFRENEFTEEDVPKDDALTEGKSQSQRLRDVLYVLWAQKADPKIDYNTYYRQETEKIIAHYKSKID